MFEVYYSQSFLSSCQHHTAFPATQDASSMAKIQVLVSPGRPSQSRAAPRPDTFWGSQSLALSQGIAAQQLILLCDKLLAGTVMPVISLIRFADQRAILLFWKPARMLHRRIPLVTAGSYGRAASGALIKIKHSLKS